MNNIIKQTWWDNNLPKMNKMFFNWIGDSSAPSKVFFRKFLKNKGYKSIIDIGCGPATEYNGFKNDNIDIEYMGVDSSKFLYDLNTSKNIPMIQAEAHKIPVDANSYEISLTRHVLEHQPHFKPVLNEMIRISTRLVVCIFFIAPQEKEIIDYNKKSNLYHNTYNINDIESFLNSNKMVSKYEWYNIPIPLWKKILKRNNTNLEKVLIIKIA